MPDDFSFSLAPAQIKPHHVDPDTTNKDCPNPDALKLELSFPYCCGDLVAAEFDVRVEIASEDDVLLLGAVELYGFNDQHQGSYEPSRDQGLNKKIRDYVLKSDKETDRAREILDQNRQKSPKNPGSFTPNNSSNLSAFISAFQECYKG